MVKRLLLVAMACTVCGCAGYAATSGRVVITDEDRSIDVSLSRHDRALIEDYFRGGRGGEKGLPPGLAKRNGDLPPGLAKRRSLPPGLARRDRLPDDVQFEPLPYDLDRKLSRLPANYLRVRVGADILVIDRRTRIIMDVAYGLGGG